MKGKSKNLRCSLLLAISLNLLHKTIAEVERKVTQFITRQVSEASRCEDFIDTNLEGKFSESEAAKLVKIALLCTGRPWTMRCKN
ncbi:hypothetical protein SLEP1_g2654 [Rubroshorea leprosula]|uniref:Uncharacterized protein n=1 Tax=Rubroshorea leprosula TaxID=152421 RepID=A0AAV5HNU6_9ROSI|nr:hypothetical protein SLEP1_g2654 [Rubroshorea leprosula]